MQKYDDSGFEYYHWLYRKCSVNILQGFDKEQLIPLLNQVSKIRTYFQWLSYLISPESQILRLLEQEGPR